MNNSINTKKKASRTAIKILRHQAKQFKLPIREDGFMPIDVLIKYINKTTNINLTLEMMLEIVDECNKQRFGLKKENNKLSIRANQGHSMPHIKQSLLLEEIYKNNLPQLLYHGTYSKCIKFIENTGLSKMNRNNIHMVTQLPNVGTIISGMRNSCDQIVVIDAHRAYNAGIKFYLSKNGVVLSPGNKDGHITPEFITIKKR